MSDIWVYGVADALNQLAKIEHKINRLNKTHDYVEYYAKQLEEEAEKEQKKEKKDKSKKNEPSLNDFKQACDAYLNQLKLQRIKNDELEAQVKDLKAKLASSEDSNRILLTTIDILNNKIEDIEEYLYINDRDEDFDNEEEEQKEEQKEKNDKPKQEKH